MLRLRAQLASTAAWAVALSFVASSAASAADMRHLKKKPAAKAPAPPAPPSDPKAKFPKASKQEPHSRVITLKPGQKSIDKKTLDSAPTANDWGTRMKGKRPPAKGPHPPLPPGAVIHTLPPGLHRAQDLPRPKPVSGAAVKKKKLAKAPAKPHRRKLRKKRR
jgi:hypothetical protein